MATRPTVILGAGLAGLSLARALQRVRPGAPIVLLDRRTAYGNDRTWCFWAVPGVTDARLATARWSAWRTVDVRGSAFTQSSRRLPYVHVPADRWYAAALDALGPSCDLRLGVRVLGVHPAPGGWVVATSGGDVEAAAVVDAMGGRGPLLAGRRQGSIELRQRFLGLEVETERPVFDPGAATLMDFRLDPVEGAMRFAYVLPFSPTRALVEDTTIGADVVLPDRARRAALQGYLEHTLGAGGVTVVREERGVLPMSAHRFAVARADGVWAVGQAAGAARPSSGYAFARTQKQAAGLARTLAHGAPPPQLDPLRRRTLDDLFLRALAAAPETAPAWFCALAERVPGEVFARFMTDAGTPADDARMVRALASPRFVRAMARGRSRALRPTPAAREPSPPVAVA